MLGLVSLLACVSGCGPRSTCTVETGFRDQDGDGVGTTAIAVCAERPFAYAPVAGDCDDLDARVHPGAPETCLLPDEDCDGLVDEDTGVPWFPDADRDGHGAIGSERVVACTAPDGYAAAADDCDDATATTFPTAPETCNRVDDDCDGRIDDGPGFTCDPGAHVACTTRCATTGTGTCTTGCVAPTGPACTPPVEVCDGRDQDCDDRIDEGVHGVHSITHDGLAGAVVVHTVGTPSGWYVLGAFADGHVVAQPVSASGGLGPVATLVPATAPGRDVYTGFVAAADATNLYVGWWENDHFVDHVYAVAAPLGTLAPTVPVAVRSTSTDAFVDPYAPAGVVPIGGALVWYWAHTGYPILFGRSDTSFRNWGAAGLSGFAQHAPSMSARAGDMVLAWSESSRIGLTGVYLGTSSPAEERVDEYYVASGPSNEAPLVAPMVGRTASVLAWRAGTSVVWQVVDDTSRGFASRAAPAVLSTTAACYGAVGTNEGAAVAEASDASVILDLVSIGTTAVGVENLTLDASASTGQCPSVALGPGGALLVTVARPTPVSFRVGCGL